MIKYPLEWGKRTYVMGIINVTPDSFSGDGILQADDVIDRAVRQAIEFEKAGVDILDIGGESTRPGSKPISVQEELDRILPVIESIRPKTDLFLSVDTYKARVAEVAISSGANWINDVWGLRADAEMPGVAARANCPVVLMHNRSKPNEVQLLEKLGGMYLGAVYTDLLEDVKNELKQSVDLALQAGVLQQNIIVDPGIGFGKTVQHNLDLINQLDEIKSMGYPVLLGPSRKSFIGVILDSPTDQRLEGTLAAVSVGITRGADIIRVHDASEAVKVARMTDALVRR